MKVELVLLRKGALSPRKVRLEPPAFSSEADALQFIANNQPCEVLAVRYITTHEVMQKESPLTPEAGVNVKYSVATFREAGLHARWTKTRDGRPIIACRENATGPWYVVDADLWVDIERGADIKQAFANYTALGGFFSVPA